MTTLELSEYSPLESCEVHPHRLAVTTVTSAVGTVWLCDECYMADDVRCPKCGFREFGRMQDGNGTVQCASCHHEWIPTYRE